MLLWLTDIHLNFLPSFGALAFGEHLIKSYPDAQGAIITGDISVATMLDMHLGDLTMGFGKPVWFVLGNHDLYYGNAYEAAYIARRITSKTEGLAIWLTEAKPIELAPGVTLVGNDGWYDGRFGLGKASNVELTDWEVIGDFRGRPKDELLRLIRNMADAKAREAYKSLRRALEAGYQTVIFATHVSPFKESTWHNGKISDDNWLPWFSSKVMGACLLKVAKEFPKTRIITLCGHSHSRGRYEAAPNMTVLTGRADYGVPIVEMVLDPLNLP